MGISRDDYRDIEAILVQLGFTHEQPGEFHHNLVNYSFDFTTARTPEEVIRIIFEQAANIGYESAQQNMKNALGI